MFHNVAEHLCVNMYNILTIDPYTVAPNQQLHTTHTTSMCAVAGETQIPYTHQISRSDQLQLETKQSSNNMGGIDTKGDGIIGNSMPLQTEVDQNIVSPGQLHQQQIHRVMSALESPQTQYVHVQIPRSWSNAHIQQETKVDGFKIISTHMVLVVKGSHPAT